jgi:hypothetical protein
MRGSALAWLFAALLLAWMLRGLPEEVAALVVMDEAIQRDEAGDDDIGDHDALPTKVAQRIAASADASKGPSLFAGEGVLALRCPRAGVLDVRRRARQRLAG